MDEITFSLEFSNSFNLRNFLVLMLVTLSRKRAGHDSHPLFIICHATIKTPEIGAYHLKYISRRKSTQIPSTKSTFPKRDIVPSTFQTEMWPWNVRRSWIFGGRVSQHKAPRNGTAIRRCVLELAFNGTVETSPRSGLNFRSRVSPPHDFRLVALLGNMCRVVRLARPPGMWNLLYPKSYPCIRTFSMKRLAVV